MKGASAKRSARRGPRRRAILKHWKEARAQLKAWRRDGATVQVRLRRPRAIDVVPIDYLRGEPVETEGKTTLKFSGRLIDVTGADITVRRPSGAILIVDRYEIVAISRGKARFEPEEP